MRNQIRSILSPSVLVMAAFACGACGHNEPPNAPENTPDLPVSDAGPIAVTPEGPGPVRASGDGTGAALASNGSSSGSSGTGDVPSANAPLSPDAPASPPPTLTDAQILEVTHVANRGEIDQARLAETRTKDARVKAFAAMMIKDHTDADSRGAALAKRQSLTLTPSPMSMILQGDAMGATATLKDGSTSNFDKNYVDTQVKEHQGVLDAIDQKLGPEATSADVKAYLNEVRARVAVHLQQAQALLGAIQK
jgi:putative membrane protein